MKTILIDFAREHIQRIIFALMVLAIAGWMLAIDEHKPAMLLLGSVSGIFLNKSRTPKEEFRGGTNDGSK